MRLNRIGVSAVVFGLMLFAAGSFAQSLTDKLAEKETFYLNYGKDPYSKMTISKDVIGLYNLFGEHITDGVQIYELKNSADRLSNTSENIIDSMQQSSSKEFQKRDFFEKFSNLVLTQDAIGGLKTSLMIGDQITTKFTPLTFNKVNFKGIRWDLWTSGLQTSFLLSRTSPGFLSKKERDGTSTVAYPLTRDVFGPEYYNGGSTGGAFSNADFSTKSIYGDYNWLWSVHTQNNIANKVDVGLTYINHHMSDVKQGEKWLNGEVPTGWIPSEVHFEFYDATPQNLTDAGVWVGNITMYVDGRAVEARPQFADKFRKIFIGTPDTIITPFSIPAARSISGFRPVLVAFKVDPSYWQFKETNFSVASIQQIKKISFKYELAGNYLAFVSTSRQIPPAILGNIDPNDNTKVTYIQQEQTIDNIGTSGVRIDKHPSTGYDTVKTSTTYFGEYIRKSSKILTLDNNTFSGLCATASSRNSSFYSNPSAPSSYNFGVFDYTYGINSSSITYGIDFKGEIEGVRFNGEIALNQREEKLPSDKGERNIQNRIVGTLHAEKSLNSSILVSGDFYHIAPDWNTGLVNLQASRYFKETATRSWGMWYDYQALPRPFNNGWKNIDDNDDNDAFPESDRRHYPSDLGQDSRENTYYNDGNIIWSKAKQLVLPSGLSMPYDDPDGVMASKDDRNKNSIPDYREDFLLFSQDPPEFELGIDENNNGIPDYEDDDIQSDYGYSVGQYVTSDGVISQGIQGISFELKNVWNNITMKTGFSFETILDADLDGSIDFLQSDYYLKNAENKLIDPAEFFVGKSILSYNSIKFNIIRRSQGLQFDVGNEIRFIKDDIRNDGIVSHGKAENGVYNVSYSYRIDPLNYRSAVLDNVVGNLIYTQIPNFEYGLRLKLGAEKRFEIVQPISKDFSFYDENTKGNIFYTAIQPYPDRLILKLSLVKRISYKFKFNNQYEGSRSILNVFNRLEITPQYKLSFSGSTDGQADPRILEKNLRMDLNRDNKIDSTLDNDGSNLDSVSQMRISNQYYTDNNYNSILNVPILKINYKIAEKMELQCGLQAFRSIDLVRPENSKINFTQIYQLVSQYNYKGSNVTIYIGVQNYDNMYDINVQDPVLLSGSRFNTKGWMFFAQIFSGT